MTDIKKMAAKVLEGMSTGGKVGLLFDIRESIFAAFGYDGDPTGELRGSLDVWWTGDSNTVYFGGTSSPSEDAEAGEYYGNEIVRSLIRRSDTHTLMFVDNGSGEQYWQIFSNSNEVTDEETLELFDGLF